MYCRTGIFTGSAKDIQKDGWSSSKILINANVSGDINDGDPANDDPVSNLDIIDVLEGKINGIENISAVSIVFLMKFMGIEVAVSGI